MHDLLIIGAGLAGLSAGLTAANAGLKVQIIAKGMGVTHWHTGSLDVLGYLPAQTDAVLKPFQAFAQLDERHPYRLLGAARVHAALTSVAQVASTAGLRYPVTNNAAADLNDLPNLLLPSPVGALRPTFCAPQAQATGNLTTPRPLLIVGFAGLRDFYPHLIAENLQKQGYSVRAEFLPLEIITQRRDSTTVQLAEAIDQPSRRHHLGVALSKLAKAGEMIALPAILGIEQHPLTLAELEQQVGTAICEIPTLPPSVPGIRLYRALQQQLTTLGVRIESNMAVSGFHSENGRIAWVESATSARPLKHQAGHYLLATGGVLGGGFNSDHNGKFWEVVFNLPLTVPQDRRQWFRPRFLDAQGHPVFSGGVAVNAQMQPVDGAGAPIYANLRAAGGVLAYCDPIRERSLEGVAIATGTAAAESIVSLG